MRLGPYTCSTLTSILNARIVALRHVDIEDVLHESCPELYHGRCEGRCA